MNIIPYLDFNGNCEEALHRYKEIFNGEIVYLQRFKEGPEMGIKEEHLNRIMHAQLKIDDLVLYMSDTFPESEHPAGSKISLNLSMDNLEKMKKIFDALSNKGQITMPLEKQFWGDTFGSLVDEFGIPWSMNCNEEK